MNWKAVILSVFFLALGLTACSSPAVKVLPYDQVSLQNYYLGRQYMSEGRYLLAWQHFVNARDASNNQQMIDRCQVEIAALDKLIADQR